MSLSSMDRLSILACVTGLALLAIFFAGAWMNTPQPEWLPMVIASIAGFEIFMVSQAIRNRRGGGRSNG